MDFVIISSLKSSGGYLQIILGHSFSQSSFKKHLPISLNQLENTDVWVSYSEVLIFIGLGCSPGFRTLQMILLCSRNWEAPL